MARQNERLAVEAVISLIVILVGLKTIVYLI